MRQISGDLFAAVCIILRLGITARIRTMGTILIASTGCAAGKCRADGRHKNAAPTQWVSAAFTRQNGD
jgi:hypothetical protein